MQEIWRRFDELNAVETGNKLAAWLERIAFLLAILMFVFAPHSIAATQIAWLTGMFAWFVRLFIKPRPRLLRTPLDVPLWIFFAWSLLTSIFSYDPPTSLDKMRNVALFLIFYFIVNLVKTKRAAVFLAATLITSAMVSVVWTPVERIIGRGVEIRNVGENSLFFKAGLRDGDAILKVNERKISTPEELLTEIEKADAPQVYFYRPDFYLTIPIKKADLLDGANALERFGIGSWKKSRNWRSAGFLSHYATFAEVLQIILSLAFGLFVALLLRRKDDASFKISALSRLHLLLFFCVAAMSLALLMTSTRASQLGFLVSAFSIVFIAGNRRLLLVLAVIALPVALGGLYFVQQSRNVGFVDPNDDSTKDRLTFYRKGFDLWTKDARNFSIGVGMDSTKKYIKDWDLYDNQGVPMGHFHSTPLQLVIERGLPALFLWLWVLWIYGRTLVRWLKIQSANYGWQEKGIVLGAFGGLVGFFSAGFVHYNLGTAMVAMAFFMLMGLSFVIILRSLPNTEGESFSEQS